MSVRQSLLAILDQGPCYGYQLRAEFERRTGGTWPVNAGQVYQTLDRLERDGLVAKAGESREGRGYYEITDAGRAEASAWLSSPVDRGEAPRDELAVKLAVAATLPGADISGVIRAQRAAAEALIDRLRHETDELGEPLSIEGLTRLLVVEARRTQAEAELRWLDRAERLLDRALASGAVSPLPLSTDIPKRGRPARSPS